MTARFTIFVLLLAFALGVSALEPQADYASATSAANSEPNINHNIETNEHRALFNYQMFCQGCHVADGSGHKSVPQLRGFMHNFMASQQGREYLIRVPGAANSVLNNAELAEVMNWMLREFGTPSDSQVWQPYNADEVGEYRQSPLNETVHYRENLIVSLLATQ